MIYQISWALSSMPRLVSPWDKELHEQVPPGTRYIMLPFLAEFIRTSEDDTFLFGFGRDEWEKFQKWVDDEGLKDYIVVESQGVYNPVHPERPDNLKLVVMQSLNHFQRKDRQ